MKNFFYVIFLSFIMFSCSSAIEDRIPTLQAKVNGVVFWEASTFSASLNSAGEVIISGNDFSRTIYLKASSLSQGTYQFGSDELDQATYQDTLQYSTIYNGVGSIAYLSDGQINIDSIDSDSKISGTFYFNAYDSSGENTVNISEGVFYKLSVQ